MGAGHSHAPATGRAGGRYRRRLAGAFDWLRAEARRAGDAVVEQVSEELLDRAGQLHAAAKPSRSPKPEVKR